MSLYLWRRVVAFCLAAALPIAAFAGEALPGVANFQKLNDRAYRGAQPTDQGFRNLARLGIQTVVDLREPGGRSLTELKIVSSLRMHYINVPMKGMEAPSNESIAKVLALLEDTATGPVFVHCQRGADRTGCVMACYRIEHDHWLPAQALAEARFLGMSRFQRSIQRYVRNYQATITNVATPNILGVIPSSSPSSAASASTLGTP
jgi:protein tyrosine/serine phosphatase